MTNSLQVAGAMPYHARTAAGCTDNDLEKAHEEPKYRKISLKN
jgi:hypothetical protein